MVSDDWYRSTIYSNQISQTPNVLPSMKAKSLCANVAAGVRGIIIVLGRNRPSFTGIKINAPDHSSSKTSVICISSFQRNSLRVMVADLLVTIL